MAIFIALLDYTEQGIGNIKDSPGRADQFNRIAEQAGAQVVSQYWTIGNHDGVLILDAPSDEVAASILLALGRSGNVRTTTLRAFGWAEAQDLIQAEVAAPMRGGLGWLVIGALACGGTILPPDDIDPFADERSRMVRRDLAGRGIEDARLLDAMRRVPRHELVPESARALAYADHPLPIGYGQTISQPYIVAFMTEQLRLGGDERVLEIGTGSGYQAAVLAELAGEVYTIEIVPELAQRVRRDLDRLGYEQIHTRTGDGYRGWPEAAPFDAIVVTAAPPRIPQTLIDQLADGGRMVVPVGEHYQELVLLTRTADRVERRKLLPVRFVPMTGEVRRR